MPQSVLVVDDSQQTHDLIEERLQPEGVLVYHALDASTGVERAIAHLPDLVLLALKVGGKSGLEVCRQLKSQLETRAIPIIFLMGAVDPATRAAAFDVGAVDYVTEPFDAAELRARVRAALRTKRYQDLLSTRAQVDGLTGLWNRAYFDARLQDEVSVGVRHRRGLALAMVDVDHFKALNETCGHPFGDLVLRRVADALVHSVRAADVVCRYGGQAFGVILRETNADAALPCAERIREQVAALQLSHQGAPVLVTASVGVAELDDLDPSGKVTGEALVHAADHALYRAKNAGRNRIERARRIGPPR